MLERRGRVGAASRRAAPHERDGSLGERGESAPRSESRVESEPPGSPNPPAALLEAIYAAPEDPSGWARVVRLCTDWAGGAIGGLQRRRIAPTVSSTMITHGLEADYGRSYAEHYFRNDPHLARVARLSTGEVLLSREVVTDAEFRRSELYADWCKPQGILDLQGVVLERTPNEVTSLAMWAEAGRRFDDASRERLARLVPHLQRALRYAAAVQVARDAEAAPNPEWSELPPSLSRVAELLARGASDKEIAVALGIPLATARTYATRVLQRLRVSGRRELMAKRAAKT